jgi:phosphonate transport system ATP-binding protein
VRHVPLWRSLLRLWPEEDKAIALSALEQFDMGALAAQRAESLSGGQQQRVAICRALVQEPRLILADEPVASLDPRNSLLVMEALAEINRRYGITVLVNLHSLDLARSYCERLVGLSAGRLVFDGAPEALTDAVANELYGLEAAEAFGAAEAAPDPGRDRPAEALA